MKHYKLLMASLLLAIGGGSAVAQTDVTSTYLTNSGFDNESDFVKGDVPTGTKGTKPVSGWTYVGDQGGTSGSATFKIGSGCKLNGVEVPKTNAEDATTATGGTVGLTVGWSGKEQYTQELKTALPAGNYHLEYAYYNNNKDATFANNYVGYISSSGTNYFGTIKDFQYGKWRKETINFTITEGEAKGKVSVGLKANNSTSKNHAKLFVDYIKIVEGLDLSALDAAKAKANAYLKFYSNYSGEEKNNLLSSIEKEPTTAKELETLKNEIISNTTLFATKASIEAYKSVKETYTDDVTFELGYVAKWEGKMISNSGKQHWSDDSKIAYWEQTSEEWGKLEWNTYKKTSVSLPVGKYALVVASRSSSSVNSYLKVDNKQVAFPNKGDLGYGIDKNGNATDASDATYANGGKGRGWEWRTIEFEVTDATIPVNIEFGGSVDNVKCQWMSVSNISLFTTHSLSLLLDLNNSIEKAKLLNTTANVGTGAFQIPNSAVESLNSAISTATDLKNNSEATENELEEGINALNTAVDTYKNIELNQPDENDKFNIIISGNSGYKHNDKTLTFKANKGDGGYAMGYTEDKGVFYNQAVTLTYAGSKDLYYLSINEDNGKIIYVGLGTNYGGNNQQIRAIDSQEKALKIQIQATSTDGLYNILNTVTNTYISANGADDTGFYTANSNYKNFKIIPAIKNTATIDITDAKWATFIAPFDATLPEGVKAYTCDANEGTTLTLTEATELKANTPYILYSENIVNQSVEGYALANKESYNGGYLTGVYTEAIVEKGNYVLQNQDENGVAFYLVDSDNFKSGANKAYMTIPASAGAKSFTLDTTATALNKLLGNTGAVEVERFNAAGAKVEAPVKGLNIIKMSDGSIVKVIIK